MTLSVITHSPDALVRYKYGQTVTPPGTYLCSRIQSEDRNHRYLTANLIRVVDEGQSVNQVTEVAKTKSKVCLWWPQQAGETDRRCYETRSLERSSVRLADPWGRATTRLVLASWKGL